MSQRLKTGEEDLRPQYNKIDRTQKINKES